MKRVLLAAVAVLACGAIGWYAREVASQYAHSGTHGSAAQSVQPASHVEASAPTADEQEAVVGMGRIEPAGGVIDVGAIIGDRLCQLMVQEGETVEKGAPLAILESRGLRELELKAATGQWQNAQGRLQAERRMADVKIDAAKLNLKKAEAAQLAAAAQEKKIDLLKVALDLAQKDQRRLAGLSKELVSDQERERQALSVRQGESELESAQATLKQLLRTNQLAIEAANLELKTAHEAKEQLTFLIPVDSLEVNRKLAEAQFARTQLIAPSSGTILKIYVRPGETIGNKPVMQMANLERMVVVAEVYENEVKHVRLGQQALVSSRAFRPPFDQETLAAKVVRIGQMINTPVLKSVDPFAPADRHVVEVRLEMDDESSRHAAALSNLQVDVRFPKSQ